MARQKSTVSQLRVGILAIATIAILIIFILSISGEISLFRKTVTYTTRFPEAEGLKAGDEVRLAGKLVGKVKSVDFLSEPPATKEEKPIVITMTMEAREVGDRIRKDSQAVLAQQGFLGDRVIDITTGTRGAERLPDGAEIASADAPSLSQVFAGASDILTQFNTVGKQLQELMTNVNQGKGSVGKLLHDEEFYTNLNRTVLEAQEVMKRVKSGDGTIGRLMNDPKLYDDLRTAVNDISSIIGDARAGKGTLGKLIADDQLYTRTNEIVGKLNSASEKIDRIIGDIDAGRGTLGKLVKDEKLHNDLQSSMASIKSITEKLDKGEGTAGRLLHDEQLYNNLNQTSAELVKLLYDFRQNPKKYLSIRVSLF